jgi:hypothetical protein
MADFAPTSSSTRCVRLASLCVGLLLNFGTALMKDRVVRLVNGLSDERS